MKAARDTPHSNFTPALEAIGNLLLQELNGVFSSGELAAMRAHDEIELRLINQKRGHFYWHFLPLRKDLVSRLANSYRRYFKLALTHPRQAGRDPHQWAWGHLQPAVRAALEWIRDWYVLACDGENQYVRHTGRIEFVPGQTSSSLSIPLTVPPFPPPKSWHAPAWLFAIAPLLGIGPLKTKNVPANDSDERLSMAHTRLLLKGARWMFLSELGATIERVRNEETAAAGEIAETVNEHTRGPNKRKGWEQRLKLYSAIQKALRANPGLQGLELCGELDKRHAPPLYDWEIGGEWPKGLTWKEAWGNPSLRRKIRRVRQEALKAR